ncbi:MAG: SpoIIIAH-like family protein [Acetatifactor sp.]|nr:SpoIIIAH-like family protein [Acetatifactor sp.]
MKNLIKKNQLMITALAIMIAIAGYLQFAGANLEEEYLPVSNEGVTETESLNGVITENYTAEGIGDTELFEIESMDSDIDQLTADYLDEDMQVAEVTPKEDEIPGEAVFASTSGVEILSDAKLLKEQTRAKNKETLLEIINSEGLTEEQKQAAVSNIVKMTANAEQEAAAEMLLEAKGFSDVVVSITENAVDVVVNAVELSDVQRAQIEDIIVRKTGIAPENVVISTVVE